MKFALKSFFKAETSSPGGKINLFFGILMFILTLTCLSTGIADYVCKFFRPDFDMGMPWYANLTLAIATAVYFAHCAKELIAIDKLKVQMQLNNTQP